MVRLFPWAALLIGFILTYITIPPIVALSHAKKLFDVPDKRKLNKIVVPTIGGVAIFIGCLVSSLLFLQGNFVPGMQYLLVAALALLFVGLEDDILLMSAWKKFVIQLVVVFLLVLTGDFEIVSAHGLFGVVSFSPWIGVTLSAFTILFLVNAINLCDGIDGLASGLSLVVSLFLGTWFLLAGDIGYAIVCYALTGSLVGFMRFNLWGKKNKIFMGDTGSLVLGVTLAAMTIRFTELNMTAPDAFRLTHPPLIALALFIVPVTDTVRVFFIRIWEKRSPFSPDMNHIHHLLIKGGLNHVQATVFLIGYTLFFVALALTFSCFSLEITASFSLMVVLSFAFVGTIQEIIRYRERWKTLIQLKKLRAKTIQFNTAGNGSLFAVGPVGEKATLPPDDPVHHIPRESFHIKK